MRYFSCKEKREGEAGGRAARRRNIISSSTPAVAYILYKFNTSHTHTHTHKHTNAFSSPRLPFHVSVCPIMTHPACLSSSPPLNHDDDMCNFLNGAPQLTAPHLPTVRGKLMPPRNQQHLLLDPGPVIPARW